MKIFHKLTLSFLVFAVLVWLMSFYAVTAKKKEVRDAYINNTQALASNILRQMDREFHDNIEVFEAYSKDLILQETVLESNRNFELMGEPLKFISEKEKEFVSSPGELSLFVKSILDNELSREMREKVEFYEVRHGHDIYPLVAVTNKYGAVIGMTETKCDYRQDDEEWWQAAKRAGMYMGSIQYDEKGDSYFVNIALRIDDRDGNFIGVMKLIINAEKIIGIASSVAENKDYLTFRLMTGEGELIYSNREDEGHLGSVSDIHEHRLAAGSMTERTHHYESNGYIFVHVHSKGLKDFKGFGWMLLVGRSSDGIFPPVAELRTQMFWISSVVTIVAILMGFFVSVSISRSVSKLGEAAAGVGRGELDVPIEIRSKDEIGQLAMSFKNMTKDLKKVTVNRDELAREVMERERAQEDTLQSRVEWENTFDTIPDMITIHDKDYNIVRANRAAKETLNLPGLETGTPLKCYQYYHGEGHRPEKCQSCNTFKTMETCSFEMFEPHLNKHVEVRSMPKFGANGDFSGVIHIVRDITNTKRAEDKVQHQMKRINALHSVEKAITSTFDLNVTLDILLDQIIVLLDIDAAAVLLLNQYTNRLEYAVSKGFRSSALKYTKLKLGESNAGRAAIERSIVTIQDLRANIDGFAVSGLLAEEEFVSYFAAPLVAKGQIKGVLEIFHRSPLDPDPEWMEFLETVANQAAIAIDNTFLFDGLQRSNIELTLAYDTTIEGWSRALDMRDKETEGHSQRVTEMTVQMAIKLGIKEDEIVHIRRGSLLHDIGKMGIPDSILLKPGKLTDEEWRVMKLHPVYAYEMLQPIRYLHPAIYIPYCHHERWDGTGYPRGLKGEDIPLSARIFAIVDVWDALSSDRPYRLAWPRDKVDEHVRKQSGTHFDPEIVDDFLKVDWSNIYHPDQLG